MENTHTPNPTQEVTVHTFTVNVPFAHNAEDAITKLQRHLDKVPGFTATPNSEIVSESKMIYAIEVHDNGGDRDDLWVVLTSYGMSPGADLGSVWSGAAGLD